MMRRVYCTVMSAGLLVLVTHTRICSAKHTWPKGSTKTWWKKDKNDELHPCSKDTETTRSVQSWRWRVRHLAAWVIGRSCSMGMAWSLFLPGLVSAVESVGHQQPCRTTMVMSSISTSPESGELKSQIPAWTSVTSGAQVSYKRHLSFTCWADDAAKIGLLWGFCDSCAYVVHHSVVRLRHIGSIRSSNTWKAVGQRDLNTGPQNLSLMSIPYSSNPNLNAWPGFVKTTDHLAFWEPLRQMLAASKSARPLECLPHALNGSCCSVRLISNLGP